MSSIHAGSLALAVLLMAPALRAQIPIDDTRDRPIDSATRLAVIERALSLLDEHYIFPATATKARQSVQAKIASGAYNAVTTGRALARQLTQDLVEATLDKHITVVFTYDPVTPPPPGPPPADLIQRIQLSDRKQNYAFKQVERLGGNVGYLRLDNFTDPEMGAETVAAAMNFLRNTETLIIDLRFNLGGNPAMVSHLASYLFPDRRLLNTLIWGREGRRDDFYTDPSVKGSKFLDKPVYVLTSSSTFSAGEEFAYDLQTQRRSITVGETTGGGANPGGFHHLHDHFGLFIPAGRAENPITRTNWEGVGVRPDVEASSDSALKAAHILSLLHILGQRVGLPDGQILEARKTLKELLSDLGERTESIRMESRTLGEEANAALNRN